MKGQGRGRAEFDPLDLRATPRRIRAAARGAGLSELALNRGLRIATQTPEPAEWRRFLSTSLALLGTGLLLAGAVCFVAYNWQRFGRFAKFALIAAGIVAAALFAWRTLPRMTGRIALLAAAVLVGPLLAVYGQTYQTGADPYGLFLTWLLLIVPWVIASRFAPLWVLAIGLLDLTLILYWGQVVAPEHWRDLLLLPLTIAALHFVALAAWEWQRLRARPWLGERWGAHVVLTAGYVALFLPAVAFVVADTDSGVWGFLGAAALWGAIGGAWLYYQRVYPDRFVITVAAATGMVWIAFVVGRVIFDALALRSLGYLFMAAFVVLEITIGLKWYRGLSGSGPRSSQAEA